MSSKIVRLFLVFVLIILVFSFGAYGFEVIDSFATPYSSPRGLTWDGSHIWLADYSEEKIFKMDPNDGEVLDSVGASCYPTGLAWDGSHIWFADVSEEKIFKIDSDGNVIKSLDSKGKCPKGLTWDGSHVWVADASGAKIYGIDPTDEKRFLTFSATTDDPTGLAWDGNYFWIADNYREKILKIDSDGEFIREFDSPGGDPRGLTWDGIYLWNADAADEKIYKIKTHFQTSTPTESPTTTFSMQDTQKSSETAPERYIESIKPEQNYPNATGNDSNTTIVKVRLEDFTSESESKRSSHDIYFVAVIGAIATIVAAIIGVIYAKK